MHWNTEKVIAQLTETPLPGNPVVLRKKEAGGDWDIPGFDLEIEGINDAHRIVPFKDPAKYPDDKMDDTEIYALEVRTFQGDSRGGLGHGADEQIAILYGSVKSRLNKAGWMVIRHYDEIF